jgi:ribosomal protein L24
MRGDHRGVEGKISRVDLAKYRIYVEGLTREKVDGTTVSLAVHPSKVVITRLNLDDKWRKKILETKKEGRKKPEEAAETPEAIPVEKPKEAAKAAEAAEAVAAETVKAVETVEEKPAPKKKAPRKRITRIERKTPAKKVSEKAKPEAIVTEGEEKPRPKKRTRRSPRKTAKKTEEEGQ